MSGSSGQRRVTVVYRGRVQGVGFRYTAVRVAEGFPVQGYVMNLEGGSVRLEAEGDEDDLQNLLDAIGRSAVGPGIRETEIRWGDARGQFQGFRIRYQTLE